MPPELFLFYQIVYVLVCGTVDAFILVYFLFNGIEYYKGLAGAAWIIATAWLYFLVF